MGLTDGQHTPPIAIPEMSEERNRLGQPIGPGAGPWVTGVMYDRFGTYLPAFSLSIMLNLVSAIVIWLAAPARSDP
jgi:hypothetical protein